jgi:hypothetical protein
MSLPHSLHEPLFAVTNLLPDLLSADDPMVVFGNVIFPSSHDKEFESCYSDKGRRAISPAFLTCVTFPERAGGSNQDIGPDLRSEDLLLMLKRDTAHAFIVKRPARHPRAGSIATANQRVQQNVDLFAFGGIGSGRNDFSRHIPISDTLKRRIPATIHNCFTSHTFRSTKKTTV